MLSNFYDLWWVFVVVGGIATIVSFAPKPAKRARRKAEIALETRPMKNDFLIPQKWDPTDIGVQIRTIQRNPNVVRVFVDSLVTRFVTGQDDRVAKRRIEFLKTKLEELSLSKDIQASLDELEFRRLNLDIKRAELEIQAFELQGKKSDLAEQRERKRALADLEHRRDLLKIEVEMASLEQQKKDFQRPDYKQPELSPEEKRKEAERKLRQKLDEYKQRKKEIKASAAEADEKAKLLNIISKKEDELYEQLEKYL